MGRKKKEILIDVETAGLDFEGEFIASLNEQTKLAKLEDLDLKFSPEEINLPEPIDTRTAEDIRAAGTVRKSKPRYVRGDRFYLYLGQKRVNGKWRGAVEHVRITEEEKTVEVLTKVWDAEKQEVVKKYVNVDVRVRKQSKPSKAYLARQKEAA